MSRHSRQRRWVEAGGLALAAALGVVQAMPPETSAFRLGCAMLSAGIPVLIVHWRHGDAQPVVRAAPDAG